MEWVGQGAEISPRCGKSAVSGARLGRQKDHHSQDLKHSFSVAIASTGNAKHKRRVGWVGRKVVAIVMFVEVVGLHLVIYRAT